MGAGTGCRFGGDLLANTIGAVAGAGMAVVAARYMDVE